MSRARRTAPLAVAMAAVLGLSACSDSSEPDAAPATAITTAPAAATTSPAAATTTVALSSNVVSFGTVILRLPETWDEYHRDQPGSTAPSGRPSTRRRAMPSAASTS